ncbi:hypothetical protein JCM11251_005881 [Rhodosporidiobolus azoricus]
MASYNGRHTAARPHSSFLPHPALPSSQSFSDEVALDIRQREAAASGGYHQDHQQNGLSPGGVGGGYARTPPAGNGGGGGVAGHSRTGSSGSAVFPSRIRPRSETTSPYMNGAGGESRQTFFPYGQEEGSPALFGGVGGPTYGLGAEEDARSLRLGGSRPSSTVGPLHSHQLQNGHSDYPMQSTVSLGVESARTTALDYLYLDEDGRAQNAPGYQNGGENGEERARENGQLSKHEAWYFLRALVGQELRHEEGLLWKLGNLDRGGNGLNGLNRDVYDEHLDPQEAPVLRYLIRHFLLTLPLIRDVSSSADEVPTFWTEGLYPIIRAVHDADFSKPVDRGSSSSASGLFGTGIRNALERFVAAGLKLSSAYYETFDEETGPASVPMHPQGTSSSGRYNFQPSAPPPVEIAPTSSSSRIINRRSSNSGPSPPSSSSGRRFSLGRLFGGVDRSPLNTAPPNAPLPPSLPSHSHIISPAPPPSGLAEIGNLSLESGSASETAEPRSEEEEPRRRSAGPARPDSTVLPGSMGLAFGSTAPFVAQYRPPTDFPAEELANPPIATRAAEDGPGIEELDLARSDSRTTGLTGLDTESFVSAQESAVALTASGANSDAEDDDIGDVTASFPIRGLAPPLSSGGTALHRESSATGTVRGGGASTDTDGFEYYPSDIANTPTEEKPAPNFAGTSFGQPLPTGKVGMEDAEPYVVEGKAGPADLPPPIPYFPYLESPSPSFPPPPQEPLSLPSSSLPRARTPISISPFNSTSSKSLRGHIGLAGTLRGGKDKSREEDRSRSAELREVPAQLGDDSTAQSHSFPLPLWATAPIYPETARDDRNGEDTVAHMTLPSDFPYPSDYQQHQQYASASEAEQAGYQPRDALPPVLLPKGGVPWPYDAQVPFARGPLFEELKWGGFEVDIVGVRKNLFSHSYIVRVRRPARLDEYVLRSEAQFHKFYRALSKAYPQAHIRRIPTSDPKNDLVIRPRPSLPTIASSTSLVSGMLGYVGIDGQSGEALSRPASRSRTRLAFGLRTAAADPHHALAPTRTATRTSTGSTFARSLRAQSVHAPGEVRAIRTRPSRTGTISSFPTRPHSAAGSYRSFPTTLGSRLPIPGDIGKKMPPHDPRRRALRAWLRDVLSVRTVGHHRETAAFLLLGSFVPKERDVLDIAKRELIDDARHSARVNMAMNASDRVKATRKQWQSVEREVIHGEGLSEISETLRKVPTLEQLPMQYQKVIESLRFSFAESLFDALVAGESSGTTFAKLRTLNNVFPWFLAKQALRLKSSNLMTRALQDLLLSRRFGGKSLLQKILATCLDDDPVRLAREMDRLQARIGSAAMCEKLSMFAHESREKKAIIRRYAEENNIELVLCIVRGADEPRLPGFELDRVSKAAKAWRKFVKTEPTPLAKVQNQDPDCRLVLDLQAFLVLASRDRDATVFRQMLSEEKFADAIEVVAEPLVQLLRRTYKVGNAAQFLSDLQKFLDQLVIIVEALRSRVQEPQKGVRIIARLLARHQQRVYAFVRSVHRKETLVEEILQWAWTASIFLRRGLAQPINLDDLLPPDDADEKSYLLEELEDLVTYHTQKRLSEFQASCRRYAGDIDADDAILVEGDGKGRSQVEPIVEPKPRPPRLSEISLYASAFKEQLRSVFAV